jgi:hypothetical protein
VGEIKSTLDLVMEKTRHLTLSQEEKEESYCQMLCMALGGDPFFNNTIDEFYTSDYFSKPLRMM